MPSSSPFSDVRIPDVDLWGLMFERKEKDFPDDKGLSIDLAILKNLPQNH
jgi:hypothetical protein